MRSVKRRKLSLFEELWLRAPWPWRSSLPLSTRQLSILPACSPRSCCEQHWAAPAFLLLAQCSLSSSSTPAMLLSLKRCSQSHKDPSHSPSTFNEHRQYSNTLLQCLKMGKITGASFRQYWHDRHDRISEKISNELIAKARVQKIDMVPIRLYTLTKHLVRSVGPPLGDSVNWLRSEEFLLRLSLESDLCKDATETILDSWYKRYKF